MFDFDAVHHGFRDRGITERQRLLRDTCAREARRGDGPLAYLDAFALDAAARYLDGRLTFEEADAALHAAWHVGSRLARPREAGEPSTLNSIYFRFSDASFGFGEVEDPEVRSSGWESAEDVEVWLRRALADLTRAP